MQSRRRASWRLVSFYQRYFISLILFYFITFCHLTVSANDVFFEAIPFVHSFIQSVIVTMISHELLEQFWWNWQGIFTRPYWWPDYIPEVKGQGHSRPSRSSLVNTRLAGKKRTSPKLTILHQMGCKNLSSVSQTGLLKWLVGRSLQWRQKQFICQGPPEKHFGLCHPPPHYKSHL